MRLYVDGQLVGSQSQSGSVTANDVFRIGQSNGGRYFAGEIDQVRVWTAALSQTTLRERSRRTGSPSTPDLVASYRLDAEGGATAFDVRSGDGSSQNGALQGDASFTPVSGVGLGQTSTMIQSGSQTLGPSGGSITVQNVSSSGSHALALYQYGRTDGPTFGMGEPGEDFSQMADDITKRLHVVWGMEPVGTSPTGDVTLDYSGLSGLTAASNVRLLKRDRPGDPWQNVSGNWTWNESEQTFSKSGMNSFSQYAIGEAATPLPVELAEFEGASTDEGVQLSWTTASEKNNAGFQVVRRVGAKAKGQRGDWTEVGFVEGGGTTDQPQTYRFSDSDLPYAADSVSYRLKQVDTDGRVSFTEPITVSRAQVESVALLGTYPNPARQQATVRYAFPEKISNEVHLRLYDVLGRQVRTVKVNAEAGRHEQTFDVSGLSNGVYFLRLRAGGRLKTRKLTVVQ